MKLKRQGFYRELPHGEKCPSILDYTDKVNQKKAEKIFQYLNEGKVLVACGGITIDVINPENGFASCPELKTDGIWVWPGDLPYYVKKYHFAYISERTIYCNGKK